MQRSNRPVLENFDSPGALQGVNSCAVHVVAKQSACLPMYRRYGSRIHYYKAFSRELERAHPDRAAFRGQGKSCAAIAVGVISTSAARRLPHCRRSLLSLAVSWAMADSRPPFLVTASFCKQFGFRVLNSGSI